MLTPIIAAAFALLSPQFAAGAPLSETLVWNRDGCHGANRSPALHWTDPPARTKAFALTVFDPDAGPAGWWHWVVYDIPATRRDLAAGFPASAASIRQGRNDFGVDGYGGPCPPPGPAHHYVFTLYAVDIEHLPVGAALRGPGLIDLLRPHVLATAKLTGVYGR